MSGRYSAFSLFICLSLLGFRSSRSANGYRRILIGQRFTNRWRKILIGHCSPCAQFRGSLKIKRCVVPQKKPQNNTLTRSNSSNGLVYQCVCVREMCWCAVSVLTESRVSVSLTDSLLNTANRASKQLLRNCFSPAFGSVQSVQDASFQTSGREAAPQSCPLHGLVSKEGSHSPDQHCRRGEQIHILQSSNTLCMIQSE